MTTMWPAKRWLSSPMVQEWIDAVPCQRLLNRYLRKIRREPVKGSEEEWKDVAAGGFKWPKEGIEPGYYLEDDSVIADDVDYWGRQPRVN